MSIERENLNNEEIIRRTYEIMMKNDGIDEEELNLLMDKTTYKKSNFGWRLFELITKSAKHPKSSIYNKSIRLIEKLFLLFPENRDAFKSSYKRMFANMILGLGSSNFNIRTGFELDCVLDDFGNIGFPSTKSEVFKIIFDKLLKNEHIISHFHFETLSYFLDLEKDIQSLFSIGIKDLFIIGLLAEKYLKNKLFRFKIKKDNHLLNNYIDQARQIRNEDFDALNKKIELYKNALFFAMANEDGVIQFCFSKYFIISAQLYYRQDNKIFALICYDFAKIFFKLRGKKYEKISSKAYYYDCLAHFYKNEKQFHDQEVALGAYIKNVKKLYEISKEKHSKLYCSSLIKFYQVKIKNALYTSNFKECVEICNSFLKEKSSKITSILTGDFIEDMILAFKAYKAEAKAKLFFERNDFSSALILFEKALKLHGQRTEQYSYGEISKIEKHILYTKAKKANKSGENNLALSITENLINQYKKQEYVPYEFKIFLQIIDSKISIETGMIESAINKLKIIVENEEVIDQYGDLYQSALDLYKILKPYIDFVKPTEVIEELIFNTGENLDDIKSWNYREYNLPIQQTVCNNLYIDISDGYFTHLIKNTEKSLGIKFPKNNSKYYSIFENIILRNIKDDENTKEFVKRYHKEGQKDPMILSSNGGIIDGNKRLAAIKLAKISDDENPNIKSKRDYLVLVVRIPVKITKKEILELKSELNYQTVFEIKEQMGTKKLLYMINMLKVGLKDQKACEILNIQIEKVSFYRALYNLIEEFLIYNNLEGDYYIIDKYGIFKHFEELNTELSKLGIKIDKSGEDLIILKEKLKEIVYIWLTNNIEDDLISRRRILKSKMIKKIKFLLIDPERNKFIDKILKKEMTDKVKIHQFLSGLVKKIKISEEKRSCIDQAKLIYEKIKYLKSRLNRTEVSIKEKNETIKSLNRSKAELSELISKVNYI